MWTLSIIPTHRDSSEDYYPDIVNLQSQDQEMDSPNNRRLSLERNRESFNIMENPLAVEPGNKSDTNTHMGEDDEFDAFSRR